MQIRSLLDGDKLALGEILEPVFRAGDTYTVDPEITFDDAIAFWCAPEKSVFVAEQEGKLLGTYYIKPNQAGGGAHVCNCGYVTAAEATGKGVARAMLAHSLDEAVTQGYRAMQYNFVVSANTRAVKTWEHAGFEIVGRLPEAFKHPKLGYVDALVMFKSLV